MTNRPRKPRRSKPFGLYNVMDFGKHWGDDIQTIINNDPDYLAWCCDNVHGFSLTAEAERALDIALLE